MRLTRHDRLSIIASAGAAGLIGWIDGPTGGGMCIGCSMDIDAYLEGHDGAAPCGDYDAAPTCGRVATTAEVLAWVGYR